MPRRGRGSRLFQNINENNATPNTQQQSQGLNLEGGARRSVSPNRHLSQLHTDNITNNSQISHMNASEFTDALNNYNIRFSEGQRGTFPTDVEHILNTYKNKITPSSERKLNFNGSGLKVTRDERSTQNFKIMPWENSIPLITGYNSSNNTVKTATVEFEKFSNTQLIGSRNAGGNANRGNGGVQEKLYRSTIMTPQTKIGINKNLFPKEHPLDMENMEILNFQENGRNISGGDNIKELLNRGVILPVGFNQTSGRHEGYYIPDFASLSNTFGMEHEVGFLNTENGRSRKARYLGSSYDNPSNRETGQSYVDGIRNFMKDMGEHFGFQPAELLRYSAYMNETGLNPNSPFQTKPLRTSTASHSYDSLMYTHEDPTAPGVEFSLGVGTLPEMMVYEHFFNKFLLEKCDGVRNPSSGYGMHMNIGVPHSYIQNNSMANDFRRSIGAYHTLAGNVIQRLTRTKNRENASGWNEEPYSSTTSPLDSGKVAIRTDSGKFNYGVIEYRFPHGGLGGDYVSNLMIMGSKMTQDMMDLHDNNIRESNIPTITKQAQRDDLRSGHSSGNSADERFVQHFLSKIGVDDPIEQKFVINLNKQCKRR